MCTISHGRNLNKMYGEGAKQKDQEKPLRLDGKLDNIYEIEGYRIRRYVDNEGQVAIILVKRIGTKKCYITVLRIQRFGERLAFKDEKSSYPNG